MKVVPAPLIVILLLAGCGESRNEAVRSTPTEQSVAVTVATAEEQSWPSVYEATGTVRARTSAVVSARMTGYIREMKVREGDRVRAGQLLLVLDSRDLDVGVNRANAALEEVRSAIPEADSAVAAAQATQDLAQTTFRRMQELLEKRSITNQEFDEVSAKLKAVQAQLSMARARRAQLDTQTARVSQDVKGAEVARTFAEVTAPFDGIVTARSVEAGSMATPGAPLVTIEHEGTYRLEASVEESKLTSIAVGRSVSVRLDGVDRPIASRVVEIVPVIDAASRSYIVKADLPPLPGVRSGLFGRASFALGQRSLLAIPAASVRETGQLQSVLVIENGIARTRLVTLGEKLGDRVEVLSGLAAAETIVSPRPISLADGSPVEVHP